MNTCAQCNSEYNFYVGCECGLELARAKKCTLRTELIRSFPFKSTNEMASLEFVPEQQEDRTGEYDPDYPEICIRLVVWEYRRPDCKTICDVKEQVLYLPKKIPSELIEHRGRLTNYVEALKEVLGEVLNHKDIESAMPTDFFKLDPLGKKTFGTKEEFVTALRTKGRLGKYLEH